jgi:large subunit ribosomal protein L25
MGLLDLRIYPRQSAGKNANRRTRAAGRIPGVIYGAGRPTGMIEVDEREFERALTQAGGDTAIFALQQERAGEQAIALLRQVQRHPVSDQILHLDLYEIPRNVPVVAAVRIEVTGESPAIKHNQANLSHNLDTVEIRCLPRDLPEFITVDISELKVNDKVYVRDLQTPAGEIVTDPEHLVLQLRPPAIFAAAEAAAEEEAVEGEGEGEGEGESGQTEEKSEE